MHYLLDEILPLHYVQGQNDRYIFTNKNNKNIFKYKSDKFITILGRFFYYFHIR